MVRDHADIIATGAVACLACAAVAEGAPRAMILIFGILLLVAPGYLLAQLVLPARTDTLERVAVIAGFTLAIPILGGLLLYAAKVPLRQPAWLGLPVGVTVVADVALFMRRRSGRAAQFTWQPASRLSRMPFRNWMVFGAALLIAVCAVAIARAGVAVQPQTRFTQLWLSPVSDSQHMDNLGVTNDEGSTTSYRLVLLSDGRTSKTWNLTLADGGTWQIRVPAAGTPGLVANLYRLPNLTQPYRHVSNGIQKSSK